MRNAQILISILVVLCSTDLFARDNCTGTYHNVNQASSTYEISKDVKLVTFSSLSSNVWREGDEVRAGACAGHMFIFADGKYHGVFSCGRKNKAGDAITDDGSFDSNSERGNWRVTFASGALAKHVGDSGWWQPVLDDGKVTVGIWGAPASSVGPNSKACGDRCQPVEVKQARLNDGSICLHSNFLEFFETGK